ncbi:MAG: nuclear transport factor 2 family protein [Alphaproteobacteria bacterium]|nr:nuclear transport factor 2 family protein [Alphaproteobacteria bacterium]
MDDILKANRAFYTAFSDFDIRAMEALWSGRPSDVCVHPGWEPLIGWHDIRLSWVGIFASTTFMRVAPSDERVFVTGEVARLHCVENIYSMHGGATQESQVATTHVFERIEGLWRLVMHHGSPLAVTQRRMEAEGEA